MPTQDPFNPLPSQRNRSGGGSSPGQPGNSPALGKSGAGGGGGKGGPASKLDQTNSIAAISTPLGANALVLRGASVTEALGRLPSFEVDMISEKPTIDPRQLLGQTIGIRLNLIGGKKRFFHGHVVQFGRSASPDRYFAYQATVVPWLWFLTRTSNCRIFQNKNVPDIIEQIFKEHGFEFQTRLSGAYTPWEYCVQYRETDFNFVSRLMEQEGIYYYFQYEESKHVLVLADSPSAHDPLAGYEKISFLAPGQHGTEEHREHIREFVPQMNHLSGMYVHTDFDFQKPRADLFTRSQLPGEYTRPDAEVFDYPGEYILHSDGEDWARTRMEEIHAQIEIASGWGDTRGLAAGRTFTLTDPEFPEQAGKYLVTSARHSFRTNEYETGRTDQGPVYACRFLVQPAERPFRAARVTPKPRIQGVQTAIVTGPKGEEIFTDKFGRIKVQFHWDREGKFDENTTCFMRVSQFWAGRRWGATFLPRIGQEVVVAFLEGDPDQPLVTGSVYNGDQMPPYLGEGPDPKHKNDPKVSGIKSCSTKGGEGYNELRFDDTKGKEEIFIHGERNLDVRIKNDRMENIANSSFLTVGTDKKGDQFEHVEHDKHLVVRHNQEEHIGGDQKLLVGGLDGPGNQDVNILAGRKCTIGADDHLHVKGVRKQKIDKTSSLTVGGDQQEKVGKNHALEAAQEIHLKAGTKAIIEAGVQLTIKVGGNFIDISPAGVTIKGTMVLINSGGSAGSGSGSSPEDPTDAEKANPTTPTIADDSKSGSVSAMTATAPPPKTPPKPAASSPAAPGAAAPGTPAAPGVPALPKPTPGFFDCVKNAAKKAGEAIDQGKKTVDDAAKAVKAAVDSAHKVEDKAKAALKAAEKAVADAKSSVQSAGGAVDHLKAAAHGNSVAEVKAAIKSGQDAVDKAKAAVKDAKDAVTKAKEAVDEAVTDVKAAIKAAEDFVENVKETVKKTGEAIEAAGKCV